jgi:ketosteroid isomerase-like protein
VTELEEFLQAVLPRQAVADHAVLSGDPEKRSETYSHNDPVTLFGAKWSASGWDNVRDVFRQLSAEWSNGHIDFELLAAGVSGDLAYTVGYEHTSASPNGGPDIQYRLRVTHVYRRENGEWKIVHRHADGLPDESAPAGQ